jgi:protein O-mannosyl-transferase
MKDTKKVQNKGFLWLGIGFLSFVTIASYIGSLSYPFQFDDLAHITKKFAIRMDNPFSRWSFNSRWVGEWLNTLSFQIGKFDPFYYRLINLFFHLLGGILLFFLVYYLCSFFKKDSFFSKYANFVGFITSLLFLIHPVQTQTVSYVVQARTEGVASVLIIATLLWFVLSYNAQFLWLKGVFFALLLLSVGLSFGTKEIVVVIPILMILIDWFFLAQEKWSIFKKHLLMYVPLAGGFIFVVAHLMGMSNFIRIISLNTSIINNRGNIVTDDPFQIITAYNFLISEFKVLLHYLYIFLWPFNISVEYDWKLSKSFLSLDVVIPFIILMILLSGIIFLMVRRKYSFISFGLLWFFITMIPRTTLIPSPELACDYKTYLASVGIYFIFAVLITKGIVYAYSLKKRIIMFNSFATICLGVIAVPFVFSTVQRNKVWRCPVAFWANCAKNAPGKARTHNNYGVALSEVGRFDEALVAYKKAISLDAHYQDPWSNISVAFSAKGDIDKAIDALKHAISIASNYPEAYNNLGSLCMQKNNFKDAEGYLHKAIELRPYYGKAYFNLARLAELKKDPEKVWENLKKASEGDLDQASDVFLKLGLMSLQLKKYDFAVESFKKTVELGDNSPNVWFNLANACFLSDNVEGSKEIYERLSHEYPQDHRFIHNLAETYYTQRDYEKALALFKKCTTLSQSMAQSFLRVANCLEKMEKNSEATRYLSALLHIDQAPEDFKKIVHNEIKRLDLRG